MSTSQTAYPFFPGSKGSPTSEQAAEAMAPTVNAMRRLVLEAIAKSETAISADEIAVAINRSAFSTRPRVSELLRLGLIEPDETRGRNQSGMSCHLWRVSARGREVLHA